MHISTHERNAPRAKFWSFFSLLKLLLSPTSSTCAKKWIFHLSLLRVCEKVQSSYFSPTFFLELRQRKLNWEIVFEKHFLFEKQYVLIYQVLAWRSFWARSNTKYLKIAIYLKIKLYTSSSLLKVNNFKIISKDFC